MQSTSHQSKKIAKQIAGELKRRQEEDPIRYWKPHRKQLQFLLSPHRQRLVLGGNRSGKSESGAIEAVSNALGYRPFLPEGHPDRKIDITVPNKGRICGEDYRNHIGNVIIPKLKKWIPKNDLKNIKKNAQGVEVLFELSNGSTIELMTYEQDSEKFEGSDNDWVWFDEPPPRDVYVAATRGLVDRMGRCWFTMTPLKEAWIKNELWDKQGENPDIKGFVFDIQDNVGFGLRQEAVDGYAKTLTESEKAARLHGQFLHLTGLVYPQFDYGTHVVDPFDIPDDWPIYVAIDPHPRTPHAVLFMAVDPNNRKYIFGEIFKPCLISELCQYIKAKLDGRKAQAILIDPFATAPDKITGVNMQMEFSRNKVYTIPATKNLAAGIPRVEASLKPLHEGMEPELYVFSSCTRTIFEFNNYVWDEWSGRSADRKTPKNIPRDKDDHMMENLYRLLLFNPRYRTRSYAAYKQNQQVMGYEARNPITGY